MDDSSTYIQIIENWWESFSPQARSRGNIAGGLVLIENLRTNLSFNIDDHKAARSDQLKNATRSNVQTILGRFGEERLLLKEGGRTNRGLVRNLAPLLEAMQQAGTERLSPESRDKAFGIIQSFLADKARDIFNADKIAFDYRHGMTSHEIINAILQAAYERRKAGEVSEYLVGAKLALRFPDYDIRNSAASAADDQTADKGDFQINDCVFHVTVSPNNGHFEKCKRNLTDGLRVFLIVPDKILAGTRQNIELHVKDSVSVEAIESFVSQNIEELSDFAGPRVSENMKLLLTTYNRRVAEVETDLSLQIKIPSVLEK